MGVTGVSGGAQLPPVKSILQQDHDWLSGMESGRAAHAAVTIFALMGRDEIGVHVSSMAIRSEQVRDLKNEIIKANSRQEKLESEGRLNERNISLWGQIMTTGNMMFAALEVGTGIGTAFVNPVVGGVLIMSGAFKLGNELLSLTEGHEKIAELVLPKGSDDEKRELATRIYYTTSLTSMVASIGGVAVGGIGAVKEAVPSIARYGPLLQGPTQAVGLLKSGEGQARMTLLQKSAGETEAQQALLRSDFDLRTGEVRDAGSDMDASAKRAKDRAQARMTQAILHAASAA